MSEEHLRALIEPLARRFFGEPNLRLSTKDVLRFGSRGSMAVDKVKSTWFDHENNEGGGVIDMVRRFAPTDEPGAWIEREYPNGRDPNPSSNSQSASVKRVGGDLGEFVCSYAYRDEAGGLLFEVCRYKNPKDFRQRRPDPSKPRGWDWHVTGVRMVPYRLPELRAAILARQMIFVVEGEKDAERMRKEGCNATTNPGGVGKWKGDLSAYFDGALEVVVIGDNDPHATDKDGEPQWHPDGRPKHPGQDHARAVCASLKPHVGKVRLLLMGEHWPQCPDKGDVSNWFETGHTLEQLFDIIGRLPE